VLVDGLGEQIDSLAVVPIMFVWTEADGEHAVDLLQILVGGGRQHRGGFLQSRIEGRLHLGAVQRFQERPAQDERHELGRREAQGRDMVEAVHQPPTDLAFDSIVDDGKARGLQRLEVPPHGAVVPEVIDGQLIDHLLHSESVG
jgi:hypothetical protein